MKKNLFKPAVVTGAAVLASVIGTAGTANAATGDITRYNIEIGADNTVDNPIVWMCNHQSGTATVRLWVWDNVHGKVAMTGWRGSDNFYFEYTTPVLLRLAPGECTFGDILYTYGDLIQVHASTPSWSFDTDPITAN